MILQYLVLNFKTLVDGLGGVLFQYPFKVPAYYALILRSLTVLEGLALSADRNYNLLGAAYPYVAKRLLTDPAPELRYSLEDLVLYSGRLRWNRLENLVREGSKSQDFDPAQIWALAEWVCSDGGRPVRKPLAAECVRQIDSLLTERTRAILSSNLREDQVFALVPEAPEEQESRRRANVLLSSIAALTRSTDRASDLAPGDIRTPSDVIRWINGIRRTLSSAGPEIRSILAKPGSQELLVDIQIGLVQRVVARGIKMAAGMTPVDTDREQALNG